MKIYVITCTGDRPEALELCNLYMTRQGHQDFEWHVVDDGVEPCDRPSRCDEMWRSAPSPGKRTLVQNLKTALGWVDVASRVKEEPGLVIIVEDDDWYHPGYVGLMHNTAQNLPPGKMLFGETHTRYYNVRWRTFVENENDEHASLCATCFTTDFLPHFAEILRKMDPEAPWVDHEIFGGHPDKALFLGSNLVVGIKGMPGRKGIGLGHHKRGKMLERDPVLVKLQEWIGDDARLYMKHYHKEEMRDVPLSPEEKYGQWLKEMDPADHKGKTCICYHQWGAHPDVHGFARGLNAHGYRSEVREVSKSGIYAPADLVVLSGGLRRFAGINGDIHCFYRRQGVPVVILDPAHFVKDAQRIQINAQHWVPQEEVSRDRSQLLKLEYVPRYRGEKILIAGQGPHLDNRLAPAISAMKGASDRPVVFRPHPNMYNEDHQRAYSIPYDELSFCSDHIGDDSRRSLEEDLNDAWCVVTHSSMVGITALMRGIPVVCAREAAFWEVSYPLLHADEVDNFARPDWSDLNNFLRRFAYTVWFDYEVESGKAFDYLQRHI